MTMPLCERGTYPPLLPTQSEYPLKRCYWSWCSQAGPYLKGGELNPPPLEPWVKKNGWEVKYFWVVFQFFKHIVRGRWGQFSATPYARQAKLIFIFGIFSPPNELKVGSFCSLTFHFPFSRSYFVQCPLANRYHSQNHRIHREKSKNRNEASYAEEWIGKLRQNTTNRTALRKRKHFNVRREAQWWSFI